MRRLFPVSFAALGLACASGNADDIVTTGRFRAEVWADNGFSLSVGEKFVFEDTVPITTERSFNKEVFAFDADFPLVLNFTLKDDKASDSGLEYIGTSKQQMGDGGFIAQLKDTTTGQYVAVSSKDWHCLVVHRAPLDTSCASSSTPDTTCTHEITEEPAGWKTAAFDASAWPAATEYTASEVGAKEGYDEVSWDATAHLIWSASLKQDNTLLCHVVVNAPK